MREGARRTGRRAAMAAALALGGAAAVVAGVLGDRLARRAAAEAETVVAAAGQILLAQRIALRAVRLADPGAARPDLIRDSLGAAIALFERRNAALSARSAGPAAGAVYHDAPHRLDARARAFARAARAALNDPAAALDLPRAADALLPSLDAAVRAPHDAAARAMRRLRLLTLATLVAGAALIGLAAALGLAGRAGRRLRTPAPPLRRAPVAPAAELRAALDAGEIETWLQPCFSARGGALTGWEARPFWRHPAHGALGPDALAAAAREAGLLLDLGAVAIAGALETLRAWRAKGLEAPVLTVDLAGAHLAEPAIVDVLRLEADRLDLDPADILVATPAEALTDATARAVLGALAAAGFGIELTGGPVSKAVAAGAPGLRRRRVDARERSGAMDGVATLADGVDSEADLARAAAAGCGHVRGALYAPPMPADLAARWLAARVDLARDSA